MVWMIVILLPPGSYQTTTRTLLQDPSVYDKPENFLPQRFLRRTEAGTQELDPTVRDPRSVAFGFGRRSVTL
jgi:cytochrome P450